MVDLISQGNARTVARLQQQVEALDQSGSPESVAATRKLGKALWHTNLMLADLDLMPGVRSFAKLLTPDLGNQLLDAYYDARGGNHNLSLLGRHMRSKRVDGDRQRIGVDPNLGDNNHTQTLMGAYQADPAPRIELHYEDGAEVTSFDGALKVSDQDIKPAEKKALLAELQKRHHGVKDADMRHGRLVVRVGNRFDPAYKDSIDRLVKRDIGDIPVRIVVDNKGDKPLAEAINGFETSYLPDGTRSSTVYPSQAEALVDRFADMGVDRVACWYNKGGFVHVAKDTTPAQAERILAAVKEVIPSDYIVVYKGGNGSSKIGYPPSYVSDDQVLAGRTDFLDRGPPDMKHMRAEADCYGGLRDSDNWQVKQRS
jgi:hypothetical protein